MSDFKQYANSFQTVINLSLKRIELLLEYMGNPHKGMNYIQVAGTNAKGSVCAFLQTALTKSGKRTGKYISPNLVRVNERITVDGIEISDNDLDVCLKKIETEAKKVYDVWGEHPTQFEIWTVLAFLYFKSRKCDIVILETGLGGRFDATNIVDSNIMSIITRIALDHTEYLGDTIGKIAFEKCGIIKKRSPVVTVSQSEEAMEVIKERASEEASPLYVAVPKQPEKSSLIYEKYDDVFLGLGGVHQLENASLAVKALELLGVNKEDILYALRNAENNGRFQLIDKNPLTIFDGGHNPNGITSLKNSLNKYFPNEKAMFICAFMKDKDILVAVSVLKETAEEICFVPVENNERCAGEKQLMDVAEKAEVKAKYFSDINEAVKYTKNKNMLTVICGSLYLYKDIEKIYSLE